MLTGVNTRARGLLLLAVALIVTSLLAYFTTTRSHSASLVLDAVRQFRPAHNNNNNTSDQADSTAAALSPLEHSRHAYCAYLGESPRGKHEDYYFNSVRMLLYQLLHDPETRTERAIPFVILIIKTTPQWKRDQLEFEGAQVIEVDEIDIDWIKKGGAKYVHVINRLRVFEQVQFDKILLLDTDVVLTRRLDDVFDADRASQVVPLRSKQAGGGGSPATDGRIAPPPSDYLMAGTGLSILNHTQPAPRSHVLSSAFLLLKPSEEMFRHYLSVATHGQGWFSPKNPDQGLWNYVHRADGDMPWQSLDDGWFVTNPNYGDVTTDVGNGRAGGVAALHEKYWRSLEKNLKEVLLRTRFRMEGFFESYHRRAKEGL